MVGGPFDWLYFSSGHLSVLKQYAISAVTSIVPRLTFSGSTEVS
jgi:hypothetical protein